MTVDDVNDTPETVELNQGKKRFKQSEPERKIVKATTKKKLLVKSDEVSDVKPSRAKRKVSSDVVSIVAQSDEISTTTTIQTETWAVLAHKKPQKDWIAYNPRTMECQWIESIAKIRGILSTSTCSKGRLRCIVLARD
ncbi:hypothetical protein RYX36_016197 [Vicia faba]